MVGKFKMNTLDEVIKALEICTSDRDGCGECPYDSVCDADKKWDDALDYLKEYKKQKHIWKKLYLLAHRMFWGLEEEYPLDGKEIENDLFDAYSEGFEDEDA